MKWLYEPQPIERLEWLRIAAPLAILGFMSSRIAHADHWIGQSGFSVPDLGGSWRQPLYIAPVPDGVAWAVAALMVLSGLATAAGFRTPWAAGVFAATLLYVGLADRLAAFTVTKVSPIIALTLCASAAGSRYGIDAWLRRRRATGRPATHVPGGPVRFIQVLLPAFYFASGVCKARGDWLARHDVLWTHLHDSYQTVVSHWLANHVPLWGWGVAQWMTLCFEIGAPLWFALPRTRTAAVSFGVGMHVLIGLMFGPVIWFSLLMIVLLTAAHAPERWLRLPFRALLAVDAGALTRG